MYLVSLWNSELTTKRLNQTVKSGKAFLKCDWITSYVTVQSTAIDPIIDKLRIGLFLSGVRILHFQVQPNATMDYSI